MQAISAKHYYDEREIQLKLIVAKGFCAFKEQQDANVHEYSYLCM